MPFSVAHVNVARGYRGGERQTELLIRELARAGVRQVLVARRGEPLAQRVADVPVEIRVVSGGPWSVATAARGTDLVHVHEGRSVYAAYLRSLWSGTPYLLTRRVSNPIRDHWLAHRVYTHAAFVAAVAPQVAQIVREYDPRIRVVVVHSGSSGLVADRARVQAIRARFPDKLVVGHVGALDNAQKGQEYIIRVARELEHTVPDVQFVLVGGGKDQAALQQLADGLTNLSFTGFVHDVADYLAAFDVFILPSNREGIGSILFDAMDQGLPVVASRVGGVPDIVHDRENGILIDAASPDQLRAAILRLRDSIELRHALGARGREVARRYTAAAMGDKYLELYRQVLAERASP